MAGGLRYLILRWLLGDESPQRASVPAPVGDAVGASRVRLYESLLALQRDQISSQLEAASSNDLVSVAALAAAFALVVALLLIKETNGSDISWWWWYGLPLFVVPVGLCGRPLQRPKVDRLFEHGPRVPPLLERFRQTPQTLESMLERQIRDLEAAIVINDRLLLAESRALYKWGLPALLVASVVNIGLYAWGLS